MWLDGRRIDLGTLGGPNSGVIRPVKNDRGMISGIAETDGADPLGERWSCSAFFPSRTGKTCRGVVWERGAIRALPTLGGSNGFATSSNNRRQVVGISGICDRAVGRFSAVHAVLWENGAVVHIGNLGGVAWNTPMAINEWGDVVGFSNVSAGDGGAFNAHAFLWTKRDGIRDLGTLPGKALSPALGINNCTKAKEG